MVDKYLEINRPITRSYRAQLLAKDAPQNKQKLLPDNNKLVQPKKKATMQPQLAPREEEYTKPESPSSIQSSTQSSLAVRSNAACGLKRKGADNNKLVQQKKKATIKPKPERQSSSQSSLTASSNNLKYIKPPKESTMVTDKVTVIKIRQDTVEEKTKPSSSSSSSSSRSLISILTTRSKAACGLNYKPTKKIITIDTRQALFGYVVHVHELVELVSEYDYYINSQPEINRYMRATVIDWLIQVHSAFRLTSETLYLTINIFDRFLAAETPSTNELQCVGASAMLIASMYVESWALKVTRLVEISGAAYELKDVSLMEKRILSRLKWNVTVPTPYVFLTRFIKAAVISPEERTMENMVHFYAELGMREYEITRFCPSMVAAAAVYATRATMKKDPVWHETLEMHTGFTEMQVMDCAKMMVRFHYIAKTDEKKKAIYIKYSSDERSMVAMFYPSRDLSAKTTFI